MTNPFLNRFTSNARGLVRAFLFSLLIGCALASPPSQMSIAAQEMWPFSARKHTTNRVHENAPTSNYNRHARRVQQRQSPVQRSGNRAQPFGSGDRSATRQATYLQGVEQGAFSSQGIPGSWQQPNGGFLPNQIPPYGPYPGQFAPGLYDPQSNRGESTRSSIEFNSSRPSIHQPHPAPSDYKPDYGDRMQPSAQTFSPQQPGYEFSQPYALQRDQEYEMSSPGDDMGGRARGYLAQGPAMQGSHLNPVIKTATETAIELMYKNEKLNELVDRTKKQLASKSQQLEKALNQSDLKDQQLARAEERELDLRDEISKLEAMLQLATQKNIKLREQTDQTLQEIETTLDEALFNSFSKIDD